MQIYRGFDHLPHFRHAVATVGSYDGVHEGHRSLLRRTREEAQRLGGESVLFTFDPHPRLTLDPTCEMRLLTTLDEKCRLIEKEGIDHLVIIPFDLTFSRTSPEEFISLLIKKAHIESLVIGYDHRFGRNKSGSFDLLRRLGTLRVIEVAEQELEHEHLSSTAIRRLLEEGEVAHAARLLGHPYQLQLCLDEEGWRPSSRLKMLPQVGSYSVSDEQGIRYTLTLTEDSTIQLQPSPTARQVILTFIK